MNLDEINVIPCDQPKQYKLDHPFSLFSVENSKVGGCNVSTHGHLSDAAYLCRSRAFLRLQECCPCFFVGFNTHSPSLCCRTSARSGSFCTTSPGPTWANSFLWWVEWWRRDVFLRKALLPEFLDQLQRRLKTVHPPGFRSGCVWKASS